MKLGIGSRYALPSEQSKSGYVSSNEQHSLEPVESYRTNTISQKEKKKIKITNYPIKHKLAGLGLGLLMGTAIVLLFLPGITRDCGFILLLLTSALIADLFKLGP